MGGIPGLVIDNATGAAWKPRRSEIFAELRPIYAAQPNQAGSNIEPAAYRHELSAPPPQIDSPSFGGESSL
jgi:hypothetical protein